MRIEQATRSHTGLVRRRNEDAWSAWPRSGSGVFEAELAVFGVADGMGGHPGGDVASSLAVSVVTELGAPSFGTPRDHLRQLYRLAARKISGAVRERPELEQMGTTLTVAVLRPGEVWVGHVGDSRLYWVRAGEIALVTRDHTLAQELIASHMLDAEHAESHYSSHVLTRCLGVCPDQAPDLLVRPLRPQPGDCLLLASDGLIKAVPTARIPALLADRSADAAVEALEEAALAGGAPDNVTVVLARFASTGETAADARGPGVEFEGAAAAEWTKG